MAFISLAILVLVLISMWKVFEKAGRQGWEGIIPIYNIYVMLQITKQPVWWLILMFIPGINIVFAILILMELAQKFGKESAFGIGLALLPFIFFPMLAFGDARYIGDQK